MHMMKEVFQIPPDSMKLKSLGDFQRTGNGKMVYSKPK